MIKFEHTKAIISFLSCRSYQYFSGISFTSITSGLNVFSLTLAFHKIDLRLFKIIYTMANVRMRVEYLGGHE